MADDERELELSPPSDDPLGEMILRPTSGIFEEIPRAGPHPREIDSDSLFATDAPAEASFETLTDTGSSAPARARFEAFAADGLICGLLASGSLLAAAALTHRSPEARQWAAAGLFALLLSFFLIVPTLVLFGKTPGMSLANLSAERRGERPPFSCALRRWLAGSATLLLAGLPLLTIVFDRGRRTPADLLSGWPLRTAETRIF
jgi:hypothetical protein